MSIRPILAALLITALTASLHAQRAKKPAPETREQLVAKAMAADGLGEMIQVLRPIRFQVDRSLDPSEWLHLDNRGPDLLRPLPATVTRVRGKDGAADRLIIDSPNFDVPCRFEGAIAADGIAVNGEARCTGSADTWTFVARIVWPRKSGGL